jgi:hypothetical protein
MLAARLGRSHAGGHTLADERLDPNTNNSRVTSRQIDQ